MFGDFFDTEDDVLNGRGEQLLSHNQCKPKNCASNLDLPELKRKNKEFIGLKNQGATCYLNSLIQSLFMSPEFRQAIFKLQLCNNNDISQRNEIFSEGKFIILYALQQLLAEMQLLDCRAVSTENMTKSFGWEDIPEEQQNMAQQQQDVQEAQRVLFDVLNRALVDTEYAKLISSQYEGLQVNHITCLECKMSKETAETYCDLLLQVKGFENLEESLVSYITPELLNEKNQYYCDTCQKKVDAYKGVKIRKFPNILTISLNRYDFNYKTFERIKINDKFVFGLELDCSKFIEPSQNIDKQNLQYELFAVLIHRGNAFGGHYHAYIMNLMNESNWEELINEINQEKEKIEQQQQVIQEEKIQEEQNGDNEVDEENSGKEGGDEMQLEQNEKKSKTNKKGSKRKKKGKKQTKKQKEEQEKKTKEEEQKQIEKNYADENFDNCDFPLQPTNKKLLTNWFDFNDNSVTPISVNRLQKQFGGSSESAYILIYRKAQLSQQLQQQPEIPVYLQTIIEKKNEEMEKQRIEYDELSEQIELYFIEINQFKIEELKLINDFNLEIDGIKIKFNLNQTLIEIFTLLQAIYNIEESELQNLKIIEIEEQKNEMYQAVRQFKYNSENLEQTLKELDFNHLSNFLVDFQQESSIYQKLSLIIGEESIPIKIKIRSGSVTKTMITHLNMKFNELKLLLESLFEIKSQYQLIYLILDNSQENLSKSDGEITLKELKILENSSLLLSSSQQSMEIELQQQEQQEEEQKDDDNYKQIFLEFQENNETIVERAIIDLNWTLSDLLKISINQLGLQKQDYRFRKSLGNELYYQEQYEDTLDDLGFIEGNIRLKIELGEIPMLGNIIINVINQSNKSTKELQNKSIDVICKLTFTPQKILQKVCEILELNTEEHRLFKTDWLQEPNQLITRMASTLSSNKIKKNDTLILKDKETPLPFELFYFNIHYTPTGWAQDLEYLEIISLKEQSVLNDLKDKILSMPRFSNQTITQKMMRIREIKRDQNLGKIYKNGLATFKQLQLKTQTPLAFQILNYDEELTENDIQLFVKKRNVQNKSYENCNEIILHVSKEPTIQELREQIRNEFQLQSEFTLAKYIQYDFK